MADWNAKAITDVGRNLIARAIAEQKQIVLTNCITSEHPYIESELPTLTDLLDKVQTVPVSNKTVIDNTTVKVEVNLTNENVEDAYYWYAYGIYGRLQGESEDTLILVASTQTPDYVPSESDNAWQTILNSHLKTSNSNIITVNVDLGSTATKQYVIEKIQEMGTATTMVTIPSQDWTEATDSDSNTYYYQDITVAGITSEFVGLSKADYVRPNPFNVDDNNKLKELFSLIEDMQSFDGYCRVIVSAVPDQAFNIYLYGIEEE